MIYFSIRAPRFDPYQRNNFHIASRIPDKATNIALLSLKTLTEWTNFPFLLSSSPNQNKQQNILFLKQKQNFKNARQQVLICNKKRLENPKKEFIPILLLNELGQKKKKKKKEEKLMQSKDSAVPKRSLLKASAIRSTTTSERLQ